MPTTIALENAGTPDARSLIAELEAELEPLYPRESRHGYCVEKLLEEAVTFFLIRSADSMRNRFRAAFKLIATSRRIVIPARLRRESRAPVSVERQW